MKESFSVQSPSGSPIRADIFLKQGEKSPLPLLCFCHGFKGFKDWGGWPYMAEKLVEAGFAVITFNFSHNGVGEDLQSFGELDKFKQNTYSLEMRDLEALLEEVRSGTIPHADKIDTSRIGLIAHSRGGVSAFGVASRDPSIVAVAALASVSSALRASKSEQAKWREDGVAIIKNARTGQDMPLGLELLEDMLVHRNLVENSISDLDYPVLIVQGTEDPAVTVQDAERLSSWAKQPQLELLEGADHTFGIKHPFEGSSPDFEKVISLMKTYFQARLKLAV